MNLVSNSFCHRYDIYPGTCPCSFVCASATGHVSAATSTTFSTATSYPSPSLHPYYTQVCRWHLPGYSGKSILVSFASYYHFSLCVPRGRLIQILVNVECYMLGGDTRVIQCLPGQQFIQSRVVYVLIIFWRLCLHIVASTYSKSYGSCFNTYAEDLESSN